MEHLYDVTDGLLKPVRAAHVSDGYDELLFNQKRASVVIRILFCLSNMKISDTAFDKNP